MVLRLAAKENHAGYGRMTVREESPVDEKPLAVIDQGILAGLLELGRSHEVRLGQLGKGKPSELARP